MNGADAMLQQALAALTAEPARTAALCKALLQSAPEHGDAKLVLSEALRRMGELDEARALVAPLAAAHPQWFGAHRQLGIIQADAGAPMPASLALRTAAELNPAHPTIWRELADQLGLAGDEAGAQAAYARHGAGAVVEPALVPVLKALNADDAQEALPLLTQHLSRFPGDVVALRLLSETHARMNRTDEAERALRRCIELAPDFLHARHALGQLLMGLGRNEEALAEANALLKRDPNNKGSLRLWAAVQGNLGEYEQAAVIYERLLKEDPKQARVWLGYGHTLKTLGRTEEGVEAYRRSIALTPELGESYWSLANLKTFRFSEADVAQMRALLQRPDLPTTERVNLHYALGKAEEDAGRAAQAFAHYSEGAALHRAAVGYDPDRFQSFVDRSVRLFTPDFFAQCTDAGAAARDAIFIVGLPRAGSTLLEQILSSHSQVEGTMELPDLQNITRDMVDPARAAEGEIYLDILPSLDAATLKALGETYLRTTRIQRKSGKPLFINKLPNNFQHVGLIQLILPNAKIIDARRHPMACGWSCFKQHFANGQFFTYGLDDVGRFYRDYVRLMAHYDAVLPGRVRRVIHEELVADPEPHIRALLDYCGLPFEPACLTPHETERAVRTASSEQVRQPISAKGLDSWRRFEPFLGALKDALGPVLDAYPAAPARFE